MTAQHSTANGLSDGWVGWSVEGTVRYVREIS